MTSEANAARSECCHKTVLSQCPDCPYRDPLEDAISLARYLLKRRDNGDDTGIGEIDTILRKVAGLSVPAKADLSCDGMLKEAERLAGEIGYIVVPDPYQADGEVHAPDFVIHMRPSLRALGFDVVPLNAPTKALENGPARLADATPSNSPLEDTRLLRERVRELEESADERIDTAWAEGARFAVGELDSLIPDSTIVRDKLADIDLMIAQRHADAIVSRKERRARSVLAQGGRG